MEGFMMKPLIWLMKRTMKIRKKKKPSASVPSRSPHNENKK
jgi:hypothetical protein